MNVKTYCPHCDQPIEYDGDIAGVTVNCPSCSHQVFLPKTVSIQTPIPPVLPVAPTLIVARKLKRVEIIKTSRSLEFMLFILGLLLCCFYGIGLILIIIAIIVSLCHHDEKIVSYNCSNCGNSVSITSLVCPCCQSKLLNEP